MQISILTRALWLALALGGLTSGANAQQKAFGLNAPGSRKSKPMDTQVPIAATPQTEGAKANGDVLAGIDPAALWDGRKLMPFHALDYPKMVSADLADFLNEGDYVLGMTINGQSRAYPTRYVWWHHFINDKTDQAGSEAPDFLISYCSVCNTGIRFDPRVNGKPLLFDFYGLYNGVVIMCDRDTQSVWLQVAGQAVKGPRMGAQMASRPLLDTTWGEWKRLHPDTLVMSPDNPYKRFYSDKPEPRGYDRFPMPMFAQTLTRHDTRLPAFDKVLGVTMTTFSAGPAGPDGTEPPANAVKSVVHRAYPLASIQKAGGVINDKFNGMSVVILLQSDTQTVCALDPYIDHNSLAAGAQAEAQGKTPGYKSARYVPLTFEARTDASGKTAFYDKETGTRWSIEGVGLEGPLAKKTLTRVDNHLSQWYGWAAYFPDTDIYGRADLPASQPAAPTSAPTKP